YFTAEFNLLKPNTRIPFGIHLYFQQNQHLILWRKDGEFVSGPFLEKYFDRGLKQIWIHQDDRKAFERYCSDEDPRIHPKPPWSEEGAFLAAALTSDVISREDKETLVAESAQTVLHHVANAASPEEQKRNNEAAQDIVHDVISVIS